MASNKALVTAATKKELSSAVADRMLREIRSSLVFQFRWEDLLMSAPLSLNCLGACILAANSKSVEVELEAPKAGFQYLRDFQGKYFLKANLVHSVDLGSAAFVEAESSMDKIELTSHSVYGTVDDILSYLESPEDAKKHLPDALANLHDSAHDCVEAASKVDKVFEDWMFHTCELYLACVATQSTNNDRITTNELDTAVASASIKQEEVTVKDAKAATEKLGKTLDVATDAFRKASDDYPTGWDILGQQIVGELAESLTNALNQAIPALVANLSPVAKAEQFSKMATEILGKDPKQDGKNGGTNNTPSHPPVAPNLPSATRPKDADDPAYSQVARDLTYWELVNNVFVGAKGGIDWARVRGEAGKVDQSLGFALKMLQHSQTSFKGLATAEEPSTHYTEALDSAVKVAGDLVLAVKDEKEKIGYKLPANDSKIVSDWHDSFSESHAVATKLNATAKSLPGSSSAGVGVPGSGVDPAVQTAQIEAKTAQAQAVLASAQKRLETTSAAMAGAEENFRKSAALLADEQKKLQDLNNTLEKLKASNLKLEAVKAILIQSIQMVYKLKNEISNLVRFFKAIAVIVTFATEKHVDPYVKTLKSMTGEVGNLDKVGPYDISDLQRTLCFNSTIIIRSWYSVFADIAHLWKDLSSTILFEGVNLVNELTALGPNTDQAEITKRTTALQKWSDTASKHIHDKSKERQDKIMSAMTARVEEVAQTTKLLEPTASHIQKSIKEGAEKSKQAAQDGIVHEAKKELINKHLPTDDPF